MSKYEDDPDPREPGYCDFTQPTNREALEWADKLITDIQTEASKDAPCLRDDLEDNRDWVRERIASALDRYATGRPLHVEEDREPLKDITGCDT